MQNDSILKRQALLRKKSNFTSSFFLAMKLTVLCMIIGLIQVSARGLSQKITYSAKNESIEKVLGVLKQQTGYVFFYKDKDLKNTGRVTVKFTGTTVESALAELFKDQPLSFSIEGKSVLIKAKTDKRLSEINVPQNISDLAINIDVKGRVLNEKGEPLSGVTVSVKGTNKAVAANDIGFFELKNVPVNATLVFTGVNIESYEMAVAGRTDLATINIKTKVEVLSDVTISYNTGYQSLSKERSTGSFAKPEMSLVQNRSTSMNVLQRLDGLVPGLTINNSPNAEGVLIRGLNSVNGTRPPLYVVDGVVINDLSSVNPQDIADITVLKDATAASIWGAKASNGVVVIITKKGSFNEGLKVNYDGFTNFQGKPDLHYIPVMGSQQYIQAARDIFDPTAYLWNSVSAYQNTASVAVPPHEMILYNQARGIISASQANKSLDSLAAINNVEQIGDLLYRNAALMNHTISVTGGSKKHSFYGSLSYTNTQSNKPGEQNNSYKANLRQDINVNKHVQLFLITDLTASMTSAKRSLTADNRFYPYQLFKDANGNNLSMPYVYALTDSTRAAYESRSRISLDYNPLNEFDYGYTKSDGLLNRMVGGATIKLVKGLRYEGVFGYLKGTNKTTSFDNDKSYLVRSELVQFTVAATPAATPVYYLPTAGGRYVVTNVNQRNWTVRNQLVYDNAWNNREHQLVLLAGQEAQDQLANSTRSTVRGYNDLLLTSNPVDYATLGTAGVTSPVMANNTGKSILSNDVFSQTESQTRFTSYYANAAYTYKRKYSLNGSWRIDQSNLFGIDKSAQNKPVWSVGGKWMMSEEKFMQNISWLNKLGIRATYGITGNSPAPGQAASFDILRSASSTFFPNGVGLAVSTPGNAKLTWESTQTINLGVDFSVLNNRLNGTIDLYRKNTSNLIGNLVVNSFTGYSSITGNFGDLQNKGIEFSLSSTNISSRNFNWQTIVTGAYNKNVITNLYTASPITTGLLKIQQRYLAGYSAFAVFGYQYAGLDTLGDPMIYVNGKTATKARNVATPDDVAFKGTYQPVWSGGVSNIVSYKNFTVSANVVYNLGHVMRRDVDSLFTGRMMTKTGAFLGNFNPEFADRWKKPGDENSTLIPSYVSNNSVSTTRRDITYYTRGDVNVVSASYIKLRDITLAYSLPKNLLNRIKTDNVTFRVQLSNIMLWKANKYGIDPEFQEGFFGIRTIRSGQGTVTVGAHVTF